MGHQLGEIIVKRPDALPLLWAYLCGVDASVSHATSPIKGKGRARDHDVSLGGFETKSRLTAHLVKLTFQILLAAVSASIANLFAIRPHLPYLPEFLITRLYCLPVERKYDVTFPPREGWYDPEQDGDNQMVEEEWCAPEPSLRKVYLALLRRLLEAGVDQKVAWRLFGQVKTPLTSSKMDNATSIETQSEPLTTTRESSGSQTSTEEEQVLRAPRKTPKPPPLHIDMAPPTMDDGEKLDPEVLDLLRHAMKSRWPDVFVFRGGSGESEDGLVLPDIGRAWPAASKGFHFSVSVRYFTPEDLLRTTVLGVHHQAQSSNNPAARFASRPTTSLFSTSYSRKLANCPICLGPQTPSTSRGERTVGTSNHRRAHMFRSGRVDTPSSVGSFCFGMS